MTTALSLKKKIEKNQKKLNEIKTKIEEDSLELLKISFSEIFKNHDFKSFSWNQYTPYWNDGDTCEFYAHTDSIYIDDEDEPTYEYDLKQLVSELENKEKTIKKIKRENKKLEDNKETKSWKYEKNIEKIKTLENSDIEKLKKRLNFLREIGDTFDSISQESLENMFGDHVTVTITSKGFSTERLDHD